MVAITIIQVTITGDLQYPPSSPMSSRHHLFHCCHVLMRTWWSSDSPACCWVSSLKYERRGQFKVILWWLLNCIECGVLLRFMFTFQVFLHMWRRSINIRNDHQCHCSLYDDEMHIFSHFTSTSNKDGTRIVWLIVLSCVHQCNFPSMPRRFADLHGHSVLDDDDDFPSGLRYWNELHYNRALWDWSAAEAGRQSRRHDNKVKPVFA